MEVRRDRTGPPAGRPGGAVDEKGSRLGEGVVPADEYGLTRLGRRSRARGDGGGGDDERRGPGSQRRCAVPAGRSRSPTRGGPRGLRRSPAKTDRVDARVLGRAAPGAISCRQVWVAVASASAR